MGTSFPARTRQPAQTPLPADLEQGAVEQVASWFQNRDKLGLIRIWLHQGTYEQCSQLHLLPQVKAVLKRYERCLTVYEALFHIAREPLQKPST